MIAVESVYSVLGDEAPLADLLALAEQHDAVLLIDEAHSLGVTGSGSFQGRGSVAGTALAGHPNVVVTATLSKALGSQGGAVLGSALLREHLLNRARELHFRHRAGTGIRRSRPRRRADHPGRTVAGGIRPQQRGSAGRRAGPGPCQTAALSLDRTAGAVQSIPMPSAESALAAAGPRAAPASGWAASARRPFRTGSRGCGSPPAPPSRPKKSKTAAKYCAAFWRNFHEPAPRHSGHRNGHRRRQNHYDGGPRRRPARKGTQCRGLQAVPVGCRRRRFRRRRNRPARRLRDRRNRRRPPRTSGAGCRRRHRRDAAAHVGFARRSDPRTRQGPRPRPGGGRGRPAGGTGFRRRHPG